ncbi:YutD family protein [Aerococcaceae bacterium DSM 111022]|nr:YutD family protein [Aerococcaceae bacterium DSM 111022]
MTDTNISDEISSLLKDITQGEGEHSLISQIDSETILIEEETYFIVKDYREGFELEAFKNRYQTFFEKFDFIVGDWGHEQLRLRGFYQVNTPGAPYDQTIDLLEDYITEYCNFGARYFVLGKEAAVSNYHKLYPEIIDKAPRKKRKSKNDSKSNKKRNTNPKSRKTQKVAKQSRTPFKIKQTNTNKESNSKKTTQKQSRFVIRKKDE